MSCIIFRNFWNPTDLHFWRSTLQNKAFSKQNKGHLGSSYIYLYNQNTYHNTFPELPKFPKSMLQLQQFLDCKSVLHPQPIATLCSSFTEKMTINCPFAHH